MIITPNNLFKMYINLHLLSTFVNNIILSWFIINYNTIKIIKNSIIIRWE